MSTTTSRPTRSGPGAVSRRALLRRGLILGGAGVAVPVVTAVPAAADNDRTKTWDVAMLGNTHRLIPGPNVDNFDLSGSTFYVEGILYPGGTIPDGVTDWDPAAHQDQAIGLWVDSGCFISSPARPQPHRYSTQTHIFGLITPDNLFPVDQISSTGTESSRTQDFKPSTRSITGGAGRYRGATGQITQYGHGMNVTFVNIFGSMTPAPNFRFIFSFGAG